MSAYSMIRMGGRLASGLAGLKRDLNAGEIVALRPDITPQVARLVATRLAGEGGDVEGWLRLVRAYMVLGEPQKARAAAEEARRALAAEPEKLRRINDLVKSLGLDT